MFLKRIQAHGFKSFADKVSIPLDRGITGIVGPNGSGKSNVIDAVRWVMGEQNARNLRGKVATDIIFSGASARKAMSMAEVTLVFDNTEASSFCPPEYRHEPEISLTRRLYADGERDYLINKKPCRLKDILSFFTTTGLGGRSYSMIQQGQVDRILNAKPEDVRIIIEEAAGTLHYKTRRDEALRKLTITRDHLARIEDIIKELDRQRHTLKGQMEKAQRWQEISTELREKELRLFGHNFRFFSTTLDALSKDLENESSKEAEILANLATAEARQAELQNELDQADPDLDGLHEAVAKIRERIAKAESIIMGADGRTEQAKRRLEDLSKEISSDMDNLKVFDEQVSASQLEVDTAEARAQSMSDQAQSFEDELMRVDEEALVYTNRIEDFEEELKNIDRLLQNNGLRCEALSREREKLSTEAVQLEERVTLLQSELQRAQEEWAEAQNHAKSKQGGFDSELATKISLDEAIRQRDEELAQAIKNRDETKEHYVEQRARISSLQEIISQSSDTVASVSLLREEEPGAHALKLGLLAEHVRFKEEISELSQNCRIAIERWAERVVVENVEDLNELLRMVTRHELGPLPVTLLAQAHKPDSSEVANWAEDCDAIALSTYLDFSQSSESVRSYLERVYVISTLNISSSDLLALPRGVVVFTAQGLLMHGQEDFVVGTSKTGKGMLSYKAELEEIGSTFKDLEAKLAKAQSEVDELNRQQISDREQLRSIDEALQTQNKDVIAVVSALQSLRQTLDHKKELLSQAQERSIAVKNQDEGLIKDLAEQGENRLSLGKEEQRVRGEIESLEAESESIIERRSEIRRQAEARRLDAAKAETRAQALKQGFDQTLRQRERLEEALSRRYEEQARIEDDIARIKAEYDASMAEIDGLLKERETLEQRLAEKREENAAILENMREVDGNLKNLREQQFKLEKLTTQKSIESERLKISLQGIAQQATEKYHTDLKSYAEQLEIDPEFDAERSSKEVNRLRNKLEGIGAINMMAIEEYNQLIERHTFISAQREEVLNSIALLEEALEEIEETTKIKFLETFSTITTEFAGLFPILFPGGDARLELTAPEDPLNSGVEIFARLPGKKLQRMTLLSGGEKALTAISLIFALLKTKPTPFCFLDEVDAPLDEANVGRYNRVLEALSERFQFIVITHNRRTMEVLDTLFGVTMQEPGVSKVVGVDMQKDIPPHLKKAFREEDKERVGASMQ